MSIVDSFYGKEESLFKLEGKVSKGYPNIAIATFDPKMINIAIKLYSCKKIGNLFAGVTIPIYELDYHGNKILLYLSIMGSATTTIFMEQLHAKGVNTFLFIGSCGLLEEGLLSYPILVPTKSYRDEGVSYHYMAPSDFIDIPSSKKLCNVLDKLQQNYRTCINWTTDAIFRETPTAIGKRKADGCTTVDMECSAIHSVANFRGINTFQFFWPLDYFSKDKRTLVKQSKPPQEYLELSLKLSFLVL